MPPASWSVRSSHIGRCPGNLTAHDRWCTPNIDLMPELPEVEITVRRIGAAIAGLPVESALAPGLNVLKTHDPPISTLGDRAALGARRRGKHLIVDFEGGLSLLMHLMSAGRLQLFDRRAGPKDRSSRLLMPPADR